MQKKRSINRILLIIILLMLCACAAAVAFLLFVLAYTPCLATVAELRRQFGGKVAAATVGIGLIVAYMLAVIAFQTLRLVL